MKKTVFLIALSIVAVMTYAVPAKPGVVKIKMTDGSVVNATVVGDEHWHCVTDQAGNLLTENSDGLYERSDVRLSDINVKAQMTMAREKKEVNCKPMNSSTFSHGLVLLVSFSDKAFTKTNSAFDKMLNEDHSDRNCESGSARDYFANSSFGAFVPQFDVFGPYTLSRTCSYYGGNSGGGDAHAAQMIVDAVAAYIDENGENALRQYDCDGDGYVDNVFVFYAGHGENAGGGSSCIWPHRSYIYSGWVSGRTTYGGVSLGNYACTCELQGASGSTMSGIGPFCHEFSHVVGLPDVYDTQYSGHRTSSLWDVMDAGNYLNNEHTPPSYSSYERFYLGWLTPEILNEPDNVTLEGLNATNQTKIITSTGSHNLNGGSPNPSEFFMLEVRNGKGWDKYLPGEGIIITKIKYDYYKWEYNEVNNYSSDMGIDIIEAGGVKGYYSQASDPFPGTDNVTEYTPYTGQEITEISYIRDNATFKFMGGREKFKVTFDGMDHGEPVVEELMESAKNAGVTLPSVTDVEQGYTFVGWSESSSVTAADAGTALGKYYPKYDIRLFAVYKHQGVIEPTENDCVTETFDKCSGKRSIDNSMDKYTDMQGWYGKNVMTSAAAVKMGNNDEGGYLVSPRLHLSGDMTVEVVCKALQNANLIVTAENGKSDTVAITNQNDTVRLNIRAVPMDSRLTFTADANIFFIDNIQFCGAKKSPVENVEEEEYTLIRMDDMLMVTGLRGGEHVRVIDIMGRVAGETTAEGTEVTFQTGKGLYLVQIIEGAKITTLK